MVTPNDISQTEELLRENEHLKHICGEAERELDRYTWALVYDPARRLWSMTELDAKYAGIDTSKLKRQ